MSTDAWHEPYTYLAEQWRRQLLVLFNGLRSDSPFSPNGLTPRQRRSSREPCPTPVSPGQQSSPLPTLSPPLHFRLLHFFSIAVSFLASFFLSFFLSLFIFVASSFYYLSSLDCRRQLVVCRARISADDPRSTLSPCPHRTRACLSRSSFSGVRRKSLCGPFAAADSFCLTSLQPQSSYLFLSIFISFFLSFSLSLGPRPSPDIHSTTRVFRPCTSPHQRRAA